MFFCRVCKLIGATVIGVEGRLIEVEVDIRSGLPQVNIVGLADAAVRESIERVRAALQNGGLKFPMDRITVNLAPADMRKEGSAFDLAIAAGILCASGQLDAGRLDGTMLIGELALSGEVRCVPGILPMIECARNAGLRKVIVPHAAVAEASLIEGIAVEGVRLIRDWVHGLPAPNSDDNKRPSAQAGAHKRPEEQTELADVLGHLQAKRALLIAAAGMHNILFVGPPGTGKTMLCRRLPDLLPLMDEEEALAVTNLQRVRQAWRCACRTHPQAAISGAAPYDFAGRADRRRIAAEARGSDAGPSRRAVFGRDARIFPAMSGIAPPAA